MIYLSDAISYWIGEQNDSFQITGTHPFNLISGDGLRVFLSYDTGVSHSGNETEPYGYPLCDIAMYFPFELSWILYYFERF